MSVTVVKLSDVLQFIMSRGSCRSIEECHNVSNVEVCSRILMAFNKKIKYWLAPSLMVVSLRQPNETYNQSRKCLKT